MGLGQRNARKHDTQTVRVQGSADVSSDFQVGQKVITVDGFPGTITNIKDGAVSGTESFDVVLDGGIGGGDYSLSQIRPITAFKSDVVTHTAADDYPEFGDILETRPDIAINTKMGSFRVQAIDCPRCNDEIDQTTDSGELMCPTCGYNPDEQKGEHYREFNLHHESMPYSLNSRRTASNSTCKAPNCNKPTVTGSQGENNYCGDCGRQEFGYRTSDGRHLCYPCGEDYYRDDDEAGHWIDREELDDIEVENDGHPAKCEFCKDNLRGPGTGPNPLLTQASRKTACAWCGCEMDPPTPSGHASVCPDCGKKVENHQNELSRTKFSREGSKKTANGDDEDFDYSNVSVGENYEESKAKEKGHKRHRGGATCPYCKYWGMNYEPGMSCPICGHRMVGSGDVANQVHDPSDFTDADRDEDAKDFGEQDETGSGSDSGNSSDDSSGSDSDGGSDGGGSGGASSTSSLNVDTLIAEAYLDSDFAFHVTAAWSDVRAKAKRIRSEGGVHIKLSSDGYVYADVRGDNNVYETGIQRLPGKQSVASWTCGCKWGAYHWGAPDDNSRFAGRMCSHALAVQFEAQSQGMFGKDIVEDTKKPKWVPRRVVVKYDIDDNKDIRVKSNLNVFEGSVADHVARLGDEDGYYTLLALTGSVNSPFGEVIVEQKQQTPGATKPRDLSENPASAGFASAPDDQGWGDMSVKTRDAEGVGSVYGSLNDEFLFEADLDTESTLHDDPEAALPRTDGSESTLHEEPEAALPSTDGNYVTRSSEPQLATLPQYRTDSKDINTDPWSKGHFINEEDGKQSELTSDYESLQSQGSVDDIVAQFQATASHLVGSDVGPAVGDSDIAKAAKQYLEKTSMKVFSPAEQSAIINEGQHVRAANYDRLNIEGTHYEQVEASLNEDEELENIFL